MVLKGRIFQKSAFFVYIWSIVFWCAAGVGAARAQSDQAVYTDSLVNGWQNWSWATVNLAASSPVQNGTASIGVSAGPWQALYLHHDPFDSSLYTNLVFWINGGSSGGQLLQVQAELNGTAQTVVTLAPLAANTWQKVSISLSSLGVQDQTDLDGFWIQDRSGTTQPAFYVDTVSFTAAPPPSVVNLNVNAAQTQRTIDPRHFGVNTAVWDGIFDTTVTKDLLTAMGNQALRFPGGSLSDDYHWATNTTDNNTWQWATPFSAFADVATAVGAQVFITVNYGSGTPQEAASWVNASNVTNHYGFKYWEIGNEVYGSWETDNNTRPHDPYTYAQRFAQYYSQMKAVDPTIKVGAVAVPGEDSYANYTDHPALNPVTGVTHNGWTPVMLTTLKSLGVTPDFLIYHRYVQDPGNEYDQGLLLSSGTWASDGADLRMQLNDYLGTATAAGVELDCTENNSVSSSPGKQTTSLVNGLFMADSICAAMQTKFNSVIWWDLRNGQETGNNNSSALYGWRIYGDYGLVDSANPPGPADEYPTYYVGKLLHYFARGGDQLIASSSDYALLSVCAARHQDGSFGLLVINKSASVTLNASIKISNAMPASSGTQYSYGIPQDDAAQTGTGSADVASTAVNGIGSSFSYNFPPYSATVLTFVGSASPSSTPAATPSPTFTPSPTATPTPGTAVGTVKPTSLSFGKQHHGTTSSAKKVTLSNTGTASLNVSSISISAGFSQTNTCSAPLAPNSSCTISVRFSPSAKGSFTGWLKVNDNATNTPQMVSLSGTGT
jgi:alpha-N-arabinofuranosidase